MAYSKLHSSIVNSSLWTESDAVRILFITLLAVADREGCVYGSPAGLARIANIDPEDTDESFKVLMSPDKNSCDNIRSPENEGRRIEQISGGFRLLNYEYYRGLRNDDDRREQNKQAQKRYRERAQSADISQDQPKSDFVSHAKPVAAMLSPGNPPKAHAEADAEAEAEGKAPPDFSPLVLAHKVIEELKLPKRTSGLLPAIGTAIEFCMEHEPEVHSGEEAIEFLIKRGGEQLSAGGSLDRFWFESQKWRKKKSTKEAPKSGTSPATELLAEIRRRKAEVAAERDKAKIQ